MESIAHEQKKLNIHLVALSTALLLLVLTALWVPVSFELYAHSSRAYYKASLWHGINPRSLIGTIAHALALSPSGFIWLLQIFKCAWLGLLCLQIFRSIQNRYIAFSLCVVFAFSSPIYFSNALGGFVDIATYCWLLLAAVFITEFSQRKSELLLIAASVFLYFAVLTHEIALFGCTIIILWSMLCYGRIALYLVAIPSIGLIGTYMSAIWSRRIYGETSDNYAELFLQRIQSIINQVDFGFIHSHLFGIFTAAGMLWLIYMALGIFAALQQENLLRRSGYIIFFIAGIYASIAPILIGNDIQRMTNIIWLPLYFLLYDQKSNLNRWIATARPYIATTMVMVLQLMVPPVFTILQYTQPLNAYAAKFLRLLSH